MREVGLQCNVDLDVVVSGNITVPSGYVIFHRSEAQPKLNQAARNRLKAERPKTVPRLVIYKGGLRPKLMTSTKLCATLPGTNRAGRLPDSRFCVTHNLVILVFNLLDRLA